MPAPNPFPCGKPGQPACPPVPAIKIGPIKRYTLKQMQEYGQACYDKGKSDQRALASVQ